MLKKLRKKISNYICSVFKCNTCNCQSNGDEPVIYGEPQDPYPLSPEDRDPNIYNPNDHIRD